MTVGLWTVRVGVRAGGRSGDVQVVVRDRDATVADLLAALTLPPSPCQVEGKASVSTDRLEDIGLVDGARIEVGLEGPTGLPARVAVGAAAGAESGNPTPVTARTDEVALAVIGGVDAGALVPVGRRLLVGRRGNSETDGPSGADRLELDDPTVSGTHAEILRTADGFAVRDAGSRAGTFVDGHRVGDVVPLGLGALLVVGNTRLRLVMVKQDRPVGMPWGLRTGGTVPFNRPPRPAPDVRPPEPLEVPEAPSKQQSVPFDVITVVVSVIFGAVMVVVFKSWMYAMFALFGPVFLVGHALSSKFTGRKTARQAKREFAKGLADMEHDLVLRVAGHRLLLEQLLVDPAEVERRAKGPSVRLWERHPQHLDYGQLRLGTGRLPWRPEIKDENANTRHADEVKAMLERFGSVQEAPLGFEAKAGEAVGIVGDRAGALALARSLVCQAAVLHGPANLQVAVLCQEATVGDWEWCKWLPHTKDAAGAAGSQLLAAGGRAVEDLCMGLLSRARQTERKDPLELSSLSFEKKSPAVERLVLVDDPLLTQGRTSPTRSLLRTDAVPTAAVIVARTPDELPSMCTTVVHVHDAAGSATVVRPQLGVVVEPAVLAGLSLSRAGEIARALSRFEDPEIDIAGAGLPDGVGLLGLLPFDATDPEAIKKHWAGLGADPGMPVPLGMADDGPLVIDIVRDGPHGLIGGTTGSGKSELLRSLVAALAAQVDPEHLNFVLIDYKGGSAFEQCSQLPHTVGFVTDLDQHLGERALRCLEAELKYREHVLKQAGAQDVMAYASLRARAQRGGQGGDFEPMPRLLVVIDEFATMASELPNFLDALVGIAQRGRSLGVHMLLATQKPSGAINDKITANTNLRIALRVQDKADSTDVVGIPDAAMLPRSRPGRALIRLGPGEVIAIQTALSTGVSAEGPRVNVDIEPFRFPRPVTPPVVVAGVVEEEEDDEPLTDLAVLVGACQRAYEGGWKPRRPWPEPLPDRVSLDQVCPEGTPDGLVPFALADYPDEQCQREFCWNLADGHLGVFGSPGAGATTSLITIAHSLSNHWSPNDLHFYALDFGSGQLRLLEELPHTGAWIAATERERQVRLIRYIRNWVNERSAVAQDQRQGLPRLVIFIDNIGAMRTSCDDLDGFELWQDFERVWSEGIDVGISFAFSADRHSALTIAMASGVSRRLVGASADGIAEFASHGLHREDIPTATPGRFVDVATRTELQVAMSNGVQLATGEGPFDGPVAVRTLPTLYPASRLRGLATIAEDGWRVPLGILDADLRPAMVNLRPNEGLLVAGPAGSGRTSTLLTICALIAEAASEVPLAFCATKKGTPVPRHVINITPTEVVGYVNQEHSHGVLFIDDAENLEDSGGGLMQALQTQVGDLRVIASGNNEALRLQYGSWIQVLRRSRKGILLDPNLDLDGDLFGIRLPRRSIVASGPGRGYLVSNGKFELFQMSSRVEGRSHDG